MMNVFYLFRCLVSSLLLPWLQFIKKVAGKKCKSYHQCSTRTSIWHLLMCIITKRFFLRPSTVTGESWLLDVTIKL